MHARISLRNTKTNTVFITLKINESIENDYASIFLN